MIFFLICSLLAGIIYPSIHNKLIRKKIIVLKRHIHHSFHGFLISLASIPLILHQMIIGVGGLGFGLGLLVHHLASEKHLKIWNKEKDNGRKNSRFFRVEKY